MEIKKFQFWLPGTSRFLNIFMSLTTTDEPTLVNRDQSAGVASENQTPSTPQTANSQATQVDQTEADLPETLVIIEPSSSLVALNLRELWVYRELLYFLTWRDIKVRYKQTALGAAWAIIQPLFTMIIFSFVFGRVAGLAQKSGDIPYPLATYAALVPWTFFAGAVTNSGNSLVGSANLISKVYFPRMMVPAAAVMAALLDFAIASLFLLPLMLVYGRGPSLTPNLLVLPLLLVVLVVLALSVGLWMSALNVKYRDIRYALPFLIQIWMFASPILIWLSMVPQKWRLFFYLNPLTGVIEGFRSALFGLRFDWTALAISGVMSLLMLLYSLHSFRRMEKSFADLI